MENDGCERCGAKGSVENDDGEWLCSDCHASREDELATERTYCFTIRVVGKGRDEREAWEDAKSGAESKVYDDEYDSAEVI